MEKKHAKLTKTAITYRVFLILSFVFGLAAIGLSFLLNYNYSQEMGVKTLYLYNDFAHFCKYILDSIVGYSEVGYPLNIAANCAFIFGALLAGLGLAWISMTLIVRKKEKLSSFFGLYCILAGLVIAFPYFLLVSGVTYNHTWDYANELTGMNRILVFIILILANLCMGALIVSFVLSFDNYAEKEKARRSCLDPISGEPVELSEEEIVIAKQKAHEEKMSHYTLLKTEHETPKLDPKKSNKIYRVSYRQLTKKWQVKGTDSEKTLKLFDNKEDAVRYARQIGTNRGFVVSFIAH